MQLLLGSWDAGASGMGSPTSHIVPCALSAPAINQPLRDHNQAQLGLGTLAANCPTWSARHISITYNPTGDGRAVSGAGAQGRHRPGY